MNTGFGWHLRLSAAKPIDAGMRRCPCRRNSRTGRRSPPRRTAPPRSPRRRRTPARSAPSGRADPRWGRGAAPPRARDLRLRPAHPNLWPNIEPKRLCLCGARPGRVRAAAREVIEVFAPRALRPPQAAALIPTDACLDKNRPRRAPQAARAVV